MASEQAPRRRIGTLKDANYYLHAPYWVVTKELTPEEGGGWIACIPELGSSTFTATGDTLAEALDLLDCLKELLIPQLLDEGVELPEPKGREWLDCMIHLPEEMFRDLQQVSIEQRVPPVDLVRQWMTNGLVESSA